jgi:hypothetical protein
MRLGSARHDEELIHVRHDDVPTTLTCATKHAAPRFHSLDHPLIALLRAEPHTVSGSDDVTLIRIQGL